MYKPSYVCNTDLSHLPGEHWIAMTIDGMGRVIYFDPSGIFPMYDEFDKFLNKTTTSWTFNDKKLQGSYSSVCGQYCVYFYCVILEINP